MNGAKPETLAEEKAPNRFIIRGQGESVQTPYGHFSDVRLR